MGFSSLSREDALAVSRRSLTREIQLQVTVALPLILLMDSTRWGRAAFRHLPQIRSEVSRTTITASRTASS